jgi:hypothetical protein
MAEIQRHDNRLGCGCHVGALAKRLRANTLQPGR